MTIQLTTTISLLDVERLEAIFASLTSNGWVLPPWLVWLRAHVESRESCNDDT